MSLTYQILRRFPSEIIEGCKVTRCVVSFGETIGYMCEMEIDGKIYNKVVSWEFLTNKDILTLTQRKIMNEALGIR